jgi:hypothetical protein
LTPSIFGIDRAAGIAKSYAVDISMISRLR